MGGPDVQHWRGPINFLTYTNEFFFFFAGATAPPRDNVAPPVYEATYLNLFAAMKPLFASSVLFFLVIIFIAPTLTLSVTIDHHLENYNQMELPGAVGPESIAFDCHGKGPYVGVSDGRILKWQGIHLGWKEFAIVSANR